MLVAKHEEDAYEHEADRKCSPKNGFEDAAEGVDIILREVTDGDAGLEARFSADGDVEAESEGDEAEQSAHPEGSAG